MKGLDIPNLPAPLLDCAACEGKYDCAETHGKATIGMNGG